MKQIDDPIVEAFREMGRVGLESDKALLAVCDALKDRTVELSNQILSLQEQLLTLAKQVEKIVAQMKQDKFDAQYGGIQ